MKGTEEKEDINEGKNIRLKGKKIKLKRKKKNTIIF